MSPQYYLKATLSFNNHFKMPKIKKALDIIHIDAIDAAQKKQIYIDWFTNAAVKRVRKVNFAKLARELGTTMSLLKRSIKWHGMVDPSLMRTGRGRPPKLRDVKRQEIEWAVKENTLRH